MNRYIQLANSPHSRSSNSSTNQWVAFAGPASPSSSDSGLNSGTQARTVSRLVLHPGSAHSRQGFAANDLALVQVTPALELDGAMVASVCLAEADQTVTEGMLCVTAGWTVAGGELIGLCFYIKQ